MAIEPSTVIRITRACVHWYQIDSRLGDDAGERWRRHGVRGTDRLVANGPSVACRRCRSLRGCRGVDEEAKDQVLSGVQTPVGQGIDHVVGMRRQAANQGVCTGRACLRPHAERVGGKFIRAIGIERDEVGLLNLQSNRWLSNMHSITFLVTEANE